MNREEKITLFVLGTTENKKGQYLAKVIRTQNGVTSATYDLKTNTIKTSYHPEIISKEAIERLSYFSDCMFVSEKHDIEKQVWFLQTQRTLKVLMYTAGIFVAAFILYISICILKDFPISYFGYTSLCLSALIFLITFYLHGRIKERRVKEQSNMEIKYSDLEGINSF